MKRLIATLAIAGITLQAAFAAGADLAVVLDCSDQRIEFANGADDSTPWFEQEAVVKEGATALQSGSVEGGDVSILEAEVVGAGTFTYWMRLQDESGGASLYVELDGGYEANIEDTGEKWVERTVTIAESGTHKVSLYFYGYAPDDICWLDKVSWVPAPEEMEIAFDTGDGPAVTTCRVTPGTTYGELPKPAAWDGHDFCGWYLDPAFMEKANDDDLVQFRDHTLCARWAIKVSVLDTEDVKFTTTAGQWGAKESATAAGGYVLASYHDALSDNYSVLSATVKGAGTLTFKVKCSGWYYCYVNGNQMEAKTSDGWREVRLVVRGAIDGESVVEWSVERYSSKPSEGDLRLKDFTWAPATNDSITVTYVTNGGSSIEPETLGMDTEITYGGLPWPEREGYEFVGWYLDAELTRRAPDEEYVPFEDQTLYAKWRIPFSALNTADLEFSGDVDLVQWRVEESVVDGYVVKNGAYDYGFGALEQALNVSAPCANGILAFKYRLADKASVLSYSVDKGGASASGGMDGPTDGWQEMKIQIRAEGCDYATVALMPISYRNGFVASGQGTVELKDFEWIPAPETVTVSFDTHGAGEIEPMEVATGEAFPVLPRPSKKGWTFIGWWMESSYGGPTAYVLQGETEVPFLDVTLQACWEKPVSAMNTDRLKFTSSGAWCAYDDGSGELYGDGGLSGSATVKKTYVPKAVKSYLQAAVTGPMLLSFDLEAWADTECDEEDGVKTFRKGTCAFALYLDGKKQGGYSITSHEDGDRVEMYIPAGKHTVKWELSGKPKVALRGKAYTAESSGYAKVSNFEVVDLGAQEDMKAWSRKLKDHKSWISGDLARFAAVYRARVLADPDDYEARILYSVARLGTLAENPAFKTYAKTFGYTLDYVRMTISGAPTLNKKTAAANAMADKLLALLGPAVADVEKSLSGIPESWGGSVTISADEWPIDETVEIDIADVMFARAGLFAALASVDYLAAHDLTVDYAKADAALTADAIPSVKALPAIGNAAAWESAARNFRASSKVYETESGTNEVEKAEGALVMKGSTLSLRLAYPNQSLDGLNQVRSVDFRVKSDDGSELNVTATLYGEHGKEVKHGGYSYCGPYEEVYYTNGHPYNTRTNVSFDVCLYPADYSAGKENEVEIAGVTGTVAVRGDELVLSVNLAKVKSFASKKWMVQYGEAAIGYWEEMDGVDYGVAEDKISVWTQTAAVTWRQPDGLGRKIQKFASGQTAFLSKVRDASRLSAARALLKKALETALAADGKATARPDDGKMHFIEYDPEDADKIDFARENTERILAAVDAPLGVDFEQVAADYDGAFHGRTPLSQYDYTLLPNDGGFTKVYLGALFEGRITRALLPDTRVNRFGDVVPDFDTMDDPTIGGLFPEMTRDHLKTLAGRYEERGNEADHGEWSDPDELPKPGEKLSFSYPQYKGGTASGLPKGWKWDAKKGVLSGTASSTFTVTFKKGKKVVGTETVTIGAKPAVLLFVDNADAVAVKGTGLYSVGAAAKAVAAVQAGYAFGGWYDAESNLVANGATYSFKMPREDVSLTARTVPLEDDWLDVMCNTEDEVRLNVGEEYRIAPVYVESGTPFAVSVSGLPSGMSVSNEVAVMDGCVMGFTFIAGAPKKAGVHYATFVVKNNGGFRRTCVVKYIVGGASDSELNTAGIDMSLLNDRLEVAMPYAFAFAVQGDGCYFCGGPLSPAKSIAAKSLPPGLKATLSGGELRIYGTPTVAGKFTMDFTVTYKNKKKARAVKTVVVEDLGGVYIPTGVLDNDPYGSARGTVAGGGVKQYGATVKFTATTANKKKWFFGGWYLDADFAEAADTVLGGVDWRTPAVSVFLDGEWPAGSGMYARFVTKEEEAANGVEIDCDDFWRVYDHEGNATALPIAVHADTLPALTAKGLPAGTKLAGSKLVISKASALVPGEYAVTITAKTAAGNVATKRVTVLVPNITTAVDMGLIEGLNTGDDGYSKDANSFMQAGVKQSFSLADLGVSVSNGWTLAVTGLPKGWTYDAKMGTFSGAATKVGKTFVTFTASRTVTVKSGGKTKKVTTSYKATATFDLAPLPDYVAGTFNGATVNSTVSGESVTRIPSEDGAATVTVTAGGSISASCTFAGAKHSFSGTGFVVEEGGGYAATLSGKIGKKAVTLRFVVFAREDDTGVAPDLGCAALSGMLAANKRIDSDVCGRMMYQNAWVRADAGELGLPSALNGLECSLRYNGMDLSLRFGANGTAVCACVTSNGVNSAACNIILVRRVAEAWSGDVVVSMSARTVKSGRRTVTLPGLNLILPVEFKKPSGEIPAGVHVIAIGGESGACYDFGGTEHAVEQP